MVEGKRIECQYLVFKPVSLGIVNSILKFYSFWFNMLNVESAAWK